MGVEQPPAAEAGLRRSFVLRPAVPMGHVTGVPFVAALAAARELGARVLWPYDVVTEAAEPLLAVRARAGYDEDGLFVSCELSVEGEGGAGPSGLAALEDAVRAGVGSWACDVAAGRAAAGPLAPVLGDYFDLLVRMGEPCGVVRGGLTIARGTLAGVDVWGRATVRLDDGSRELEIAPEQASLRWS